MNRKIIFILVMFLFLSIPCFAETITITTYYPAPYGVYNKLRLFPHAPVAAECDVAEEEGTLAYNLADHTLKACRQIAVGSFAWEPVGFWTLNTTNLYPTNLNSNVGIGIATPAAKLDILGQIKIVDGNQGLNKVLTSNATGLASWQTPTGAVKPCPVGFTAVNNSYCIETNERGANTWWTASTTCAIDAQARLCTLSEWYYACTIAGGLGLSNMTNNWEWVDDARRYVAPSTRMFIVGSPIAGCTNRTDSSVSNSNSFRCCFSR